MSLPFSMFVRPFALLKTPSGSLKLAYLTGCAGIDADDDTLLTCHRMAGHWSAPDWSRLAKAEGTTKMAGIISQWKTRPSASAIRKRAEFFNGRQKAERS